MIIIIIISLLAANCVFQELTRQFSYICLLLLWIFKDQDETPEVPHSSFLMHFCSQHLFQRFHVPTHPDKYRPRGSTSSWLRWRPGRRGPTGVQSSPRDWGPAPARHHGPWARGKAAGAGGAPGLRSTSGPGWSFLLELWSSARWTRSRAGWPELSLGSLEGFGRTLEWCRDDRTAWGLFPYKLKTRRALERKSAPYSVTHKNKKNNWKRIINSAN